MTLLLEVLRALAGALVLFVLPGFAWSLAVRPGLHRDPPALVFWTLAGSVVLLVLYGTALGLAGMFRIAPLVVAALGLAAAGAVVALRRGAFDPPWEKAPDPGAVGRERTERLRALGVEAAARERAGDARGAEAARAEARRVEERAAQEILGR